MQIKNKKPGTQPGFLMVPDAKPGDLIRPIKA